MAFLSEAQLEQVLLEQLQTLGYAIEREERIGPDGTHPERSSHADVALNGRFEAGKIGVKSQYCSFKPNP